MKGVFSFYHLPNVARCHVFFVCFLFLFFCGFSYNTHFSQAQVLSSIRVTQPLGQQSYVPVQAVWLMVVYCSTRGFYVFMSSLWYARCSGFTSCQRFLVSLRWFCGRWVLSELGVFRAPAWGAMSPFTPTPLGSEVPLLGLGGLMAVFMFCQPLVQFPSWSWLPIVEPPCSDAVVNEHYRTYSAISRAIFTQIHTHEKNFLSKLKQ